MDELRAEIADRFGALMEEAEHLFALASLRVLASHNDIRKVEIVKRTLRLYLPFEDDKIFYESGRFTTMMERIAATKEPSLQLKQEGRNLFLQTFLKDNAGAERIREAMSVLGHIAD